MDWIGCCNSTLAALQLHICTQDYIAVSIYLDVYDSSHAIDRSSLHSLFDCRCHVVPATLLIGRVRSSFSFCILFMSKMEPTSLLVRSITTSVPNYWLFWLLRLHFGKMDFYIPNWRDYFICLHPLTTMLHTSIMHLLLQSCKYNLSLNYTPALLKCCDACISK